MQSVWGLRWCSVFRVSGECEPGDPRNIGFIGFIGTFHGFELLNPQNIGTSHGFRIPESANHERSQCFGPV